MRLSDTFQTQVARLALRVARKHGFALGGGQALITYGIVSRPTEDVALFTDADGGSKPPQNLSRRRPPSV